jgi:hypothetical protein
MMSGMEIQIQATTKEQAAVAAWAILRSQDSGWTRRCDMCHQWFASGEIGYVVDFEGRTNQLVCQKDYAFLEAGGDRKPQ